jgi:NAD-dependent DNA ligase
MEAVPDILVSKESDAEKVEKLKSVKGMAAKSAETFISHINDFVDFLKACGLENKLMITEKNVSLLPVVDSSYPLFGKSVVITGFRDKSLEESLKKVGAKLGSSVSKNTFLVIVKNLEEETGKVLEAKKLGIPIITLDEFQKKYF